MKVTLSPSGTTGSLSTPFATISAMTSACRWLSRARPTPWPSATATASQDTESWDRARTGSRAAPKLLLMPRAFALTSASNPSPLTASAFSSVSGRLVPVARPTRTAYRQAGRPRLDGP
eukprot:6213095-Pleurochrysis_carterae.AAC.2